MLDSFEERLDSLLELAAQAEEEARRNLRQFIKDLILARIETGERDLEQSATGLFESTMKLVSALAPDHPVAQALPNIPTGFAERRKAAKRDHYFRIQGVIDRMMPNELFQLFKRYMAKESLEDIFDSLEISSK